MRAAADPAARFHEVEMLRFLGAATAAIASIGLAVFFLVIPKRVDQSLNKIVPHAPFEVSGEAAALHDSLQLADLHDDALLWDRDFSRRQTRGHTDARRLIEGGYRLQILAAVTKTPKKLNYDENTGDTDNITLLTIAQRWPVKTWFSLLERALHIAERAEKAANRSNGELIVIRSKAELAERARESGLAVILATEGAHPLEGDINNLDRLYDAGYRILGLHHFFDNELGGSLHGVSGGGLTDFGREIVAAAETKGMIIDVAHSSEATVRDVLGVTTAPIIVSHTGLRGHCDSPRNLPDELMTEIAKNGGLIGVGFWDGAVCEPTLRSIADAIVYAINLVGVKHVALGSDFDGATTVPFEASEAVALTDALLKAGLNETSIRAVMGENAIRFFSENLPAD